MATCKWCDVDIEWRKEGDKSIPIEVATGIRHKCPKYPKKAVTETPKAPAKPPEGPSPFHRVCITNYSMASVSFRFLTGQKNKSTVQLLPDQYKWFEENGVRHILPTNADISWKAGTLYESRIPGVNCSELPELPEQKQKDPEPETNTDFQTAEKLKKDLEAAQAGTFVPVEGVNTDGTSEPSQPPAEDRVQYYERIGSWGIKISATVNLQNYENIKVEVDGPAEDREQMVEFLDDTLTQFGRNNPATSDLIDSFRARVLKKKGDGA